MAPSGESSPKANRKAASDAVGDALSASRLATAVGAVAHSDGVNETALKGTVVVRRSAPTEAENRHWRACLAIVAQGGKELILGQTRHTLAPWHYTLTPFPLPLTSRFTRVPFLSVLIGVDTTTLARVVADMDARDEPPTGPARAFFTGQ